MPCGETNTSARVPNGKKGESFPSSLGKSIYTVLMLGPHLKEVD
jgi:hypothetical protein